MRSRLVIDTVVRPTSPSNGSLTRGTTTSTRTSAISQGPKRSGSWIERRSGSTPRRSATRRAVRRPASRAAVGDPASV